MKRTNETGRSMVEMLGVLAIIGVLSIGGIAGYTTAMNRYRANEVLDMANKFATIVYTAYETNKAMNSGSTSGFTAPELCDTGLVAKNGTDCKVNGAEIALDKTDGTPASGEPDTEGFIPAVPGSSGISSSGVSLKLTFDSLEVCKAAASSLGEECGTGNVVKYTITMS